MPKTNNHYVVTLLDIASKIGIDTDLLLNDMGVTQEQLEREDMWLDNHCLSTLLKSIWRSTGDEALGLDPLPMRMGTWALACEFMLSAETLGDIYRKGQQIYSFLPCNMSISLSVNDSLANIEVDSYIGERDPHYFLIEFITVVWHRFACWVIDEYIPLKQVYFSYPAPPHYWFYEELFHCPVFFEQPACGFSFSSKYLRQPICRNKKELRTWLDESPANLLCMPGRDNSITHYISKKITRELRENMQFLDFENVCESLHMSAQVVRRRLDEEGASYQKIKDSVREDLIKELLSNPDIAIADIAERSGYTETASLTRAFKKWTGGTPAQYRNQKTAPH